MMILLTIQSIPCYKPIHLERGRKHTSICLNLILFTDINLFTSRGDGNLSVPCINIHWVFWYKPIYLERERKLKGWLHISIYRTILIQTYIPREGTKTMMILLTIQSIPCYKPIHLERGRKHTSICLNLILFTDINLFTSRGDGNLSVPCINIHWVFWYKPIYLERERKLKGWLHISIYRTILIQTYIPREGTKTGPHLT